VLASSPAAYQRLGLSPTSIPPWEDGRADGIDSMVRAALWGQAPKREHNLHIFGGY